LRMPSASIMLRVCGWLFSSVVYEDADEAGPDSAGEKRRSYGAVHAARKAQHHPALSDLVTDGLGLQVVHEQVHLAVLF